MRTRASFRMAAPVGTMMVERREWTLDNVEAFNMLNRPRRALRNVLVSVSEGCRGGIPWRDAGNLNDPDGKIGGALVAT